MFPIGTDRPQRRFPWVNLVIAINVVVFAISRGTVGPDGIVHPWPHMQELMLQPNPAIYQFITYQFLHQNFMHLAGNMLFLYVFGNNLNEKLGHFGYLMCYLTGGVMAGCGQELTPLNVATLGASGSIAAVTGLFFVLLPRINIRVFLWIYIYVDVVLIPSMWFIAFSVAKDLFESQLNPDSGVAHYAHLAGAATGMAIGFLLLGTGLVQRDHYDLLALISRWRRRQQYESLVRKGYDPFGKTPPSQIRQPSSAPQPMADPRVAELRDTITMLVRGHDLGAAAAKYRELHNLDPQQVLPSNEQLDVANQLMAEGHYDAAAPAYEDYLRAYPGGPQSDQVHLILGLHVYSQYLPNPRRAAELLCAVLPRLHNAAQREFAEMELRRLAGTGVQE